MSSLKIRKMRKTMELKSKICTSVDQSKKLLELGLKPETADMLTPTHNKKACSVGYVKAWSLSRLIELMPKRITGRKFRTIYELDILPDGIEVDYSCLFDSDCVLHSVYLDGPEATLFDAIIEMIEWLIKNKYLNKEYLCNK